MNENKTRLFHLIYACAVGVLVIALGVLFITSCIGIYRSGERPFTRESVGDALTKIAIPSAITVLAIIGGAVVNLLIPEKAKKGGRPTPSMLLSNLRKRVRYDSLTESEDAELKYERRLRLILHIGGLVILLISVVYPLVYLFTPDRFGVATTANADIAAAAIAILIFLLPAAVYAIIVSFIMDKSRAREASAIKLIIARQRGEGALKSAEAMSESFLKKYGTVITNCIRGAVIVVGILFVVLGINNGGMADVLGKAVRICTECIGLG